MRDTSSYALGDRLIGKKDGMTIQCCLMEVLDRVISTLNNVAGSAVILGNQLYGPSENTRYEKGEMGTQKGYTGQYEDETGLKYDHARYDDPVIGHFVSADPVEGNAQGFDPYASVGGNPVTYNDPTGQYYSTNDWVTNPVAPVALGNKVVYDPAGLSMLDDDAIEDTHTYEEIHGESAKEGLKEHYEDERRLVLVSL